MLPFLVYVEHRKSEYKWEMYMWMLWIKNRKKEFLEYRYVFLWDSFSLLKILENEEKRSFFSILAPRVVKVEMTLKDGVTEKKAENKPREEVKHIEKEKREAIEAGRRALNSLSAAKENLNSAKNWGLVDMFGGGFFSTMLKHSKMDHAKQNMDQAKYDLRNFSKELNDVNMACDLHIDTGDFLSFADYFFDGFVVDWMVQDRINTAKRQVEEAIRRTESIVNQLQRM